MSDEELFTKAAGLFPKDKIIVMSEEEMGTLEMLKKRWQEKALTDYKKELLSKAEFIACLDTDENHDVIPLSAIQEDTTVTPDSENRNNDPKKTSQESVTEDKLELKVTSYPDGFRFGAGDDVIISSKVLQKYIQEQQKALLKRLDEQWIDADPYELFDKIRNFIETEREQIKDKLS